MTKWPMVPLGDVLQLQRRWVKVDPLATYEEIGVRCFGNGIFHKTPIDGSTLGNKRVLRIEPGDLVFNNVFAWEGAVAVASEAEAGKIGSHRFVTYTADHCRCSVDYLRWFFKSEPGLEVLRRVSPGSAGRNRTMSLDQLPKQQVPLPSLKEQQTLVDYLNALSAKVDEAKQLRAESETEADLLSIRVMEKRRQGLLDTCPKIARLGAIAKVTAGGTPSRDNPLLWNGTIPWIKTGELLDGPLIDAAEYITEAAIEASSAKLFPIDTVLIALYGQGQTRGRTGLLMIPATTNQACAAILPCNELRPRYVQYWLRSLYREMREDTHGGAQPNWNGQMIKDISIAVPSLAHQDEVISEFDSFIRTFQRLGEEQAHVRAELEAMLPAALDQLFNSEGLEAETRSDI